MSHIVVDSAVPLFQHSLGAMSQKASIPAKAFSMSERAKLAILGVLIVRSSPFRREIPFAHS
jgi:hypothetical protein